MRLGIFVGGGCFVFWVLVGLLGFFVGLFFCFFLAYA